MTPKIVTLAGPYHVTVVWHVRCRKTKYQVEGWGLLLCGIAVAWCVRAAHAVKKGRKACARTARGTDRMNRSICAMARGMGCLGHGSARSSRRNVSFQIANERRIFTFCSTARIYRTLRPVLLSAQLHSILSTLYWPQVWALVNSVPT